MTDGRVVYLPRGKYETVELVGGYHDGLRLAVPLPLPLTWNMPGPVPLPDLIDRPLAECMLPSPLLRYVQAERSSDGVMRYRLKEERHG